MRSICTTLEKCRDYQKQKTTFFILTLTLMEEILAKFKIEGTPVEVKPLGSGLINDTYLVRTDGDAPDYVLQRINNAIFTDVELLQHNIEAVTRHLRSKLAGCDDVDRRVLRFIATDDGKTYCRDAAGNYWRLSVFIPRATTHQTVDAGHSYHAGRAFGNFEAELVDIPDTLGETIPYFHNMELRISQLRDAVKRDAAGRLAEVQPIVDAIEARAEEMCLAEQLHREGRLPKRICHCDTKVNNMMFGDDGQVLCVIDLDTVMPSFVFSDYGDFLRTAANAVAEDSPELDKVEFRRDIFEAFTRGYLESASRFLTPTETELLPYAVTLFPYMQCVRFLTDYINGDTYYKIAYPTHNLVRTRNQWRLYECTMELRPYMSRFIAGCMGQ